MICILVFCSFSFTAYANQSQTVTVYATVPNSYNVTITSDGYGEVLIANYALIASGTMLTLDRNTQQEYIFRAKSGFETDKALYNGKDITSEIEAGRWVAPKLTENSTLSVSFKTSTEKPSNIRYVVVGQVTFNGNPLANTKLELHSALKTTVTDKDGKFRFDDVAESYHTLTAINEGITVGYVEFNISKSEISGLAMNKLPEGSFEVLISNDFTNVRFDFELQKSGKMDLKTVAPITNKEDLKDFPKTGDDTPMIMLIILCLLSLVVIFISVFKRERKGQKDIQK